MGYVCKCPLGGAAGLLFTCTRCAESGGSRVHWQFQRRRIELWVPGRSSLSGGGRTAGGRNKHSASTSAWFKMFWPDSGLLCFVYLPLHRWRNQAQSRACQWSGRSSAAPPGRDVWCSSWGHCALPWCAFAVRKMKICIRDCNHPCYVFYYVKNVSEVAVLPLSSSWWFSSAAPWQRNIWWTPCVEPEEPVAEQTSALVIM